MRKISNTAMTQVTTKLGGEPLCIVAIYWNGNGNTPSYYCDRGAHQDLPELQGKIIKLANLDDVVNISNASNSQSVSITLDDTDGSIKQIYNNTDIHKKKVIIYQWFTQINFNDKFIIFEGLINSPIVWVEKDRTLSFEVVSKLEDAEIGFSPEEGDFPSINDNLIGKAWPMPFGTCLKIPAVSIDVIGSATLMDSIGQHDPKLEADMQNLFLQKQYTQAYAQALITAGSVLMANSAAHGLDVATGDGGDDGSENAAIVSADNTDLTEANQAKADAEAAFHTAQDNYDDSPTQENLDAQNAAQEKAQTASQAAAQAAANANNNNQVGGGGGSGGSSGGGGGGTGGSLGLFVENPQDPDYQQGKGMMESGQKLLAESTKMDADIQKISKQIAAQKKFEKKSVLLYCDGTPLPFGTSGTLEIGDLIVTGVISPVSGNSRADAVLNITSVTTKKPFLTHVETGTSTVERYYSADLSGTDQFGFPTDFIHDMGLVSEVDITKTAPQKIIVDEGPGFVFVKAGTKIKWVSDLPQKWIAAMLPCTVLGVYAIRDYDGTKLMTAVPSNYYTVSYHNYISQDGIGPGITATVITLKQPLSYINDIKLTTAQTGAGLVVTTEASVGGQHNTEEAKRGQYYSVINSTFQSGWEDQIYVDLISPVGPNTADILQYLVTTYSGVPYPGTPPFGCDTATFNRVRSQLAAFPMHFCLFERKNLFDALKEIAFQARCAIWLKEDIFYLLYLVPEEVPIDSITLDDIEETSLEIHHTGTEEIITKFVANYKLYYGPQTGQPASDVGSKDDKIILRANMAKYGLHEQTFQYYAYTSSTLVDLSSTFWIIRKSNTWKLVQFKTPLHKLKLETFDSVTIDLRSVSDEPVVGVVQSANLDTDAMEISFSIWVPVRIGEMFKYPGGNPSVQFFYPYITDEVGSQNIGETAGGDIHQVDPIGGGAAPVSHNDNRSRPHNGSTQPGAEALDPIISPQVDAPIGELDDTTPDSYPPVNMTYDLSTNPDINANTSAIPAQVKGPSDKGLPEYVLTSYPQGLGNKSVPTKATDASYGPNNKTKLEKDTWVMVQPLQWTVTDANGKKTPQVKRYFIPSLGGTSVYPGMVAGGSGGTYTVNIYKQGLTGPATGVQVKQLQIAGGENIPTGTWALVSKGVNSAGAVEYTMQVPVWL